MRRKRDAAPPHGEAAILSRPADIDGRIASVRRADIDKRQIGVLALFDVPHRLARRRIRIMRLIEIWHDVTLPVHMMVF